MTMTEIREAIANGATFTTRPNAFTGRYDGYEVRVYLTKSDVNPFCYDNKVFDTIAEAVAKRATYKHPADWHLFKVFVNNYALCNEYGTTQFAYVIKKVD